MRGWFIFMVALGLSGSVGAQDTNYTLSLQAPGTGASLVQIATGLQGTVATVLESSAGNELAGWSWGVCHDTPLFDILSVADGITTTTVNGGAPPAFNAPAILPGQGWTIGVVINFFGDNPLQPGGPYELHLASYAAGGDEGTASLDYCNILGDPMVFTTLVDSSGGSIDPVQQGATIEVISPQCFFFSAGSASVGYNPMNGTLNGGAFAVSMSVLEVDEGPCGGSLTQGLSVAVTDGGTSLDAIDIVPAPILQDMNGGMGPDFFGPNVDPLPGPGVTVGIVYAFLGEVFLDFTGPIGSSGTPVVDVVYDAIPGVLQDDFVGETVILSFSDALGTPPVINTVVVGGLSAPVAFASGFVELLPSIEAEFVRSDCNDDGTSNIADGVWILNQLFTGGPEGTCPEACDANDDGGIDQSDAVYIFNYRFLGGAQPPAPFPGCGIVDGVTGSECVYTNCP